ncbi:MULTISPECIES: LemA family protein [unclassified Chryseobacterium]|uniref:LemA family protein n=1 Tax=unclassified Chryseobacterium TaxID=2593645 RepID=UPI00226AA22F|nr:MULTISPECIES: LemA family protein [unclassified Chryseobacterium]
MLIPILIFIIVIVAVVTFLVKSYNQIVILRNNVDKAFSNIDVILKQRADEVPNLVRVVKATALNENTVLKELVALRSQYNQSEKTNDKVKIAEAIDGKMKSFFVSVESYPQIKASQSFLELQKRLSNLENMISDRREYFNDSVNLYNTGIQVFPDMIFAKMMRYQKMEMLKFSEQEIEYNGVEL